MTIGRMAPMFIFLASLAGASRIHAQSPPNPASRPSFDAFEVATIKPEPPEDFKTGRYMRMESAHRFQAKGYTVEGLIAAAYNLTPRAISGGPAWMKTDRFEIIGATPGDLRPAYDEQMAMVRKLLKDRFNLSFHREEKVFAIYELTVSPGGPKLTASTAPPEEPYNLTSTLFPATSGGIDHAMLPAHNATMAQFAALLQRAILDRPVVDSTGVTGRYDFELQWTPDESQFGGALPPGAPDTGKPGLSAAMEQQLGLKMASTRGPIATLVVDHLDRPSET